MLSDNNRKEIARLIDAFEKESSKFKPITFSLEYFTQDGPMRNRVYGKPNHLIMLWQYYGIVDGEEGAKKFLKNVSNSDVNWGLRGTQLTCMGGIEGEGCELFVRMATRAGTIFDKDDAEKYRSKYVDEILAREQSSEKKGNPLIVTNTHPLGVWLNYLIYFVSSTSPGRERTHRIDPDPNSLSLLALENLLRTGEPEKAYQSSVDVREHRFVVSMSFPGESRRYVSTVVGELKRTLPQDSIFYDFDFQSQLARPNLDVLLQDIYRNRTQLIVIFLSSNYAAKEWCGIEWRAIRDIIKSKKDTQVMLVRLDDSDIPGMLSLDGYIDGQTTSPSDLASMILQRVRLNAGETI